MANIEIEIASRKYVLACRDGEEEHLRSVAALVDARARDAGQAMGSLGEARQLLFAALLLADDLKELKSGGLAPAPAEPDPAVAEATEALAERIEALADRLEAQAAPTRP
jgi:cell division protein ZapA